MLILLYSPFFIRFRPKIVHINPAWFLRCFVEAKPPSVYPYSFYNHFSFFYKTQSIFRGIVICCSNELCFAKNRGLETQNTFSNGFVSLNTDKTRRLKSDRRKLPNICLSEFFIWIMKVKRLLQYKVYQKIGVNSMVNLHVWLLITTACR